MKMTKLVDLGEPTSVLDHMCLGCTQRDCKTNESTVDEYVKNRESPPQDLGRNLCSIVATRSG